VRPLARVRSIKQKLGIVIVLATAAGIVAYVLSRRALGLSGLLSLPIALATALALTQVVARGMTRPLREMAAAAAAMAAGDYGRRIERPAADEVGDLARAFNAMADELARTEQLRRELIANASHELRTPLTALKARLENVIDGVEPADGPTLDAMLAQVERLGRLVHQLLDLSRLESGAEPLDRSVFPLVEMLDRVAAEAAALAADVGIVVEVAEPSTLVHADRERLHQLLANLVANAVRHSPAGATVRIAAAQPVAGGPIALSVEDDGPGIPAEEAARVFERFYRLDAARVADDGGAGLGLAISRWIVELHGGTITTTPARVGSALPGCRMLVTLPSTLA
jgi:signal transduction histidine kinase